MSEQEQAIKDAYAAGYRRGWEQGEMRAVSREQLLLPAEYGRQPAPVTRERTPYERFIFPHVYPGDEQDA